MSPLIVWRQKSLKMNIINQTPIPVSDVKSFAPNLSEHKEFETYLKKFSNLSKDKAKVLEKSILSLNNPKIKPLDVTKIIDFLPKNQEEVNKIFTDVSLSEEESNAIIEITSKY